MKYSNEEALNYLYSLGLDRVKPGLERIKALFSILGNPQKKLKAIHIGGTNGKGSTAAIAASILQSHGYRVGLYTSPHLVRVTERIKIDGREIPIEELSRLIIEIKEISASLPDKPSFFEVLTACAFLYFAEASPDFVVVEVGMGGRWDATNTLSPIVSVITNISKEHTQYLGKTIAAIASEKAGIVKTDVPLVTGAKGKALEVIKRVARENSTPIYIMNGDFSVTENSINNFNYIGIESKFANLKLNLLGKFQFQNAAFAIAALEILSRFYEIKIEENNIRVGLSSVNWEGRIEIIRNNPPFILDGAHNPNAAKALVKTIAELYPKKLFLFVLGMLLDKDHKGFIKEIANIGDRIIITEVPSERTISVDYLANIARRYFQEVRVIKDPKKALEEAKEMGVPTCVTGSLHLVGACKGFYYKKHRIKN